MRLKTVAAASIALMGFGADVQASDALAKKYACTACHATDEKVVGPSFNDIAKKYAAQNDAPDAIATSIRKGGVGKWGSVPMPANEQISDADAKTLAAWVLSAGK